MNRAEQGETFANTLVSGWCSKSLDSGSFGYINEAGLTQFRLRFEKDEDNDFVADFLKLYSGNCLTTSFRPTLLITYYFVP